MLTTSLTRGIFSIHQIQKKGQKKARAKKILYPKISYVMSVDHAKEFLKSLLYVETFLPERHIAPTIPILKKKISNLRFISFLTYIFRKSLFFL